MIELTLDVTEKPLELVPGQTLSGRIGWRLDEVPKRAALRLFWYTEGRGTQDVEIIEEMNIVSSGLTHEERFSFTLPERPYSFSGRLITLKWALELVLNKGEHVKRVDLMVSPWVEQVKLGTVND